MKYLLDTNVLISMFRGQHGIREAILKAGIENCAISEISYGEIVTGAYRGGYDRHAHEIEFLKSRFNILPVSPAIETFGRLRAELLDNGTPIDSLDLLISATAIENGLTVITHNLKHFEVVPGLEVQDWEQ